MFGLFDWIWKLLYGISKSMYSIIDNLLATANMLCGIEPIRYAGTETDFITFLLGNENIKKAFVGAVLISIVLVTLFGVFAILRAISSEKTNKTPAQIAVGVAKTVLTFLFIPVAFFVLIYFTNLLMQILYSVTTGGSPDGLGRFLAGAFGQDALKDGVKPDFYLDSSFNYHSTSNVKQFLDLSDYDYFFSWLSSLVIILCLGMALLMFVDRAISIVILFIFAPISLSTSILDDGARFKLWRDQFITKFLTGYGCIIAINIYALIIAAITDDRLVFFDNTTLNNVMKIVIIVGGGVSMTRVMALVGNLINAGAGSNELRDAAIAAGSFRRMAAPAMMAPFRATRGAINFARDVKNTGLSTSVGRRLGFKTQRDYDIENGRVSRGQQSGNRNTKTSSNIGAKGGIVSKALNGVGNVANAGAKVAGAVGGAVGNVAGNNSNAMRNNVAPGNGQNMVSNAISKSLDNKKED